MAAPEIVASKGIELSRRLLSQTSFEQQIDDIEGILSSSAESIARSEDSSLYCHFITALLDSLSASALKNTDEEELYDAMILRGSPEDVFVVLATALQRCDKSYKRDKLVGLLDKFLRGHYLEELLKRRCGRYLKTTDEVSWAMLETLLVSLPERLANINKKDVPKALTTEVYFATVCDGLFRAFDYAAERLSNNVDVHVTFLGRLLGRLCLVGQSGQIANRLIPELVRRCKGDFLFRRVCSKVVTAVPDNSIESVVTTLLVTLEDFAQVDWFLGDSVSTSIKLKYIMTVKLPLIRTFSNDKILRNLVGYLASSDRRKAMFLGLTKELLGVWGDKTFMKHQSEQQQKYLTSALMVCTGHLKLSQCTRTERDILMPKLLHGVQSHIESPEEWVRTYGMVVAEQLSNVLQPEGPKLNFDCPNDEDVKHLLSLMDVSPRPQEQSNEDYTKLPKSKTQQEIDMPKGPPPEDLDSDDDLEAYDMSHDKPSGAKRPLYLRDCMEGLLEQEDRDWTESCLQSADGLIRSCQDELEDIAGELCKILLYMEDKYSTPDFVSLRQQALVSLTESSPKLAATYLTEQFYQSNLNIRQRLDILEVLALASDKLSKPLTRTVNVRQQESISNITDAHWKSVVMERINAKTKHISKGKKNKVVPAKSRFADVAGYFFYPLMRYYDRKENTFDLLGEDSFVLARLICTLGIVQNSAVHSPKSFHMASCLLEFLSALRYHTEACVRDAILFALSMILVNVPASSLLSNAEHELLEIRQWLQFVAEKDSYEMCRFKAAQVLQLLAAEVNKEMPLLDK
ncbi:unnamed protein product [Ixodes hexagonus]